MRDFKERVHGPYRRGNKWRIIVVTSPDDRCVESFESEREATARIASFERDIAARTIGASVEAYLAAQERRVTEGEIRPSTIERDRYHLRSMLKLSENSDLELRRLTPTFGERLYEARTGAVDTHRNGLNVVRAFGAWCVKQGWLRANPFESVKGRGRRKRGKPQLRIEEARVFQATCLSLAPRDDGAVLGLTYLLLGARAGEVVLRQVRDVDDGGRLFWIPDSKTEAGRRQLAVPAQLVPHLARLTRERRPTAPLFAHAATRGRAQDWAREQITRLCKLAGVPRVTPQGLRGTLATMGREVGNTSQQVADMLGHASPVITERAYIDGGRAEAAGRRAGWRTLEGAQR